MQESAPILIEKELQSGIVKKITVDLEVEAPVQAGQQLGEMTVSSGDKTLARIPIVAPETVEKLTWWELTIRLLRRICMGE